MNAPSNELPMHVFERFPRQDLFSGMTRRQFFQTLWKEFELLGQRQQGVKAQKLGELGCMSDEALAPLMPRILPGCQISLRDGDLWAVPASQPAMRLFPADQLTVAAFNLINGRNSIMQIAARVQSLGPLPPERAFAFSRGLFLTLVKAGVCLPHNALLPSPHD